MDRISGETMVLYADLRERLEAFDAMRSIASLPGEFTTKINKGIHYHYFQATLPGGRDQIYIGPDTEEVRQLIETRRQGIKEVQADDRMLQRLAAQIMAGGVPPIPPQMSKIISRLGDCGVFRLGSVLVGTVAFQVLGTALGVTWANAHMTQDVDFATANSIALGVPDLTVDVPATIESLEMGFFPVPRLSRNEPSTSYIIRGKTLRIDLLTPARREGMAPVFIRRLNAAATPLRYLDYLIEDPINAVMLAGTPCLVCVPQPARYALHKLIISQERDASATDKSKKDLAQARHLMELLKQDRPGDLELALEALGKRGESWVKKAEKGAKAAGITVNL